MSLSSYTYCDECGHRLNFACECENPKCLNHMKKYNITYDLHFGGDVMCNDCQGKGKFLFLQVPTVHTCDKCKGVGLISKYRCSGTKIFTDEKQLDDFVFRLHKIKMRIAFRSVGLCYTSSLDCWEKMRRQRLPYGERRKTVNGFIVSGQINKEITTKLSVSIQQH